MRLPSPHFVLRKRLHAPNFGVEKGHVLAQLKRNQMIQTASDAADSNPYRKPWPLAALSASAQDESPAWVS
jgi:hypothetical protein